MATKPKVKPESEETPADEAKESPAMQKKEEVEGTEEHTNGVHIPEAFQTQASALVNSCKSRTCLSFLQDLIRYKEQDMKPEMLSTDGMPE